MTSQIIPVDPFDLVVFGGTGDLSERKLLPALYQRQKAGQFSEPTRIIAASPVSWSETPDFRIYRNFVRVGKIDTASAYESMMQALHDNSISRYVRTFVAGQRVAAIMGGHKMARNSSGYKSVALISQKLSESGVLVCSGGGPGAMEATHLGARMAGASPGGLDAAIATLATQPTVPELANVVAPDGSTDPALIAAAHSWFKPAHQLAEKLTVKPDRNLQKRSALCRAVVTPEYSSE